MTSQSFTLYAIEERLQALVDTVDLVEPEQEEQFSLEFQEALKAAVEKRDRVAEFLAHLESQAALADAEIKRLRERKASLESVAERVGGYVQRTIESQGFDDHGRYRKLEGHTNCFSLRACPPSVAITDQDAVPARFKCLTIKLPAELWETIAEGFDPHLRAEVQQHVKLADTSVDKKALKADIDAGYDIPGADLAIGNYYLVRK